MSHRSDRCVHGFTLGLCAVRSCNSGRPRQGRRGYQSPKCHRCKMRKDSARVPEGETHYFCDKCLVLRAGDPRVRSRLEVEVT